MLKRQHSLTILLNTGYRVLKAQKTTLSNYTPIYCVWSQQRTATNLQYIQSTN